MRLEEVKGLAKGILEKIPWYFRCYEVTRKIRDEFAKIGIEVAVKDGYAHYNFNKFSQELVKNNCTLVLLDQEGNLNENPTKKEVDDYKAAVKFTKKVEDGQKLLEDKLSWRISILHSWAILQKEKLIIDCHRLIRPEPQVALKATTRFPILRKVMVLDYLTVAPIEFVKEEKTVSGGVLFLEEAKEIGGCVYYPKDTRYKTRLRYNSEMKKE